VTVDAEAGYGLSPEELVDALIDVGAAGCNLEDTDYATWRPRPTTDAAAWFAEVRRVADARGYPLVLNARIDTLVGPYLAGSGPDHQLALVGEVIDRAHAYLEAGADCVFPVLLWEPQALVELMSAVSGPVNLLQLPEMPPRAELVRLGVARISWGFFLQTAAMAGFERDVALLRD
jgi:2-methylisocitrate lyase-like PEP mutase family enzyme